MNRIALRVVLREFLEAFDGRLREIGPFRNGKRLLQRAEFALEPPQPLSEDVGRDVRNLILKLTEAARPIHQGVD